MSHGMANGLRLPGTPIIVDYWMSRFLPPRCLYFLTHVHADHMVGLSSAWKERIYCTPVTKKLLLWKISIDPGLIVELEYNEPLQLHVDCPGNETVAISVTALNAHHCPGSAMFLFEGYFGTILYTGDFRFDPSMESMLQNCQVDVLYFDNTYSDPSCVFPTREKLANEIIQQILDHPDKRTFIALTNVGKENLLVKIANVTRLCIGVSKEQFHKMEILGLDPFFSTDTSNCQISIVPLHSVTQRRLQIWSRECPTQVILPSGRHCGRYAPAPSFSHPSLTLYQYSDHSSFTELKRFVELVAPCVIKPTVRVFSGDSRIKQLRLDMSHYKAFLSSRQPVLPIIPAGIQQLLNKTASAQYAPVIAGRSKRRSSLDKNATNTKRRRLAIPKGVHFISPAKNTDKADAEPPASSQHPLPHSMSNQEMEHWPSPERERRIISRQEVDEGLTSNSSAALVQGNSIATVVDKVLDVPGGLSLEEMPVKQAEAVSSSELDLNESETFPVLSRKPTRRMSSPSSSSDREQCQGMKSPTHCRAKYSSCSQDHLLQSHAGLAQMPLDTQGTANSMHSSSCSGSCLWQHCQVTVAGSSAVTDSVSLIAHRVFFRRDGDKHGARALADSLTSSDSSGIDPILLLARKVFCKEGFSGQY